MILNEKKLFGSNGQPNEKSSVISETQAVNDNLEQVTSLKYWVNIYKNKSCCSVIAGKGIMFLNDIIIFRKYT